MAPSAALTAQDSLAALMILVSASDTNMRTSELVEINNAINNLPIFAGYDADKLTSVSQTVFDLLEQEDGLEALFGLVRDALPESLFETAYALACDVAAADGKTGQAELRVLEEVRYELQLDPLHAAAIERGAKARHMTL
jgi:tellurite resistance protein